MTRCLDEGTLQSNFDGELSPHLMGSATAHLASCVTCAAAAREMAEETALLTSALAAEFGVSVPTQALRERIDDIPLLVDHFLAQLNEKYQRHIRGLTHDAIAPTLLPCSTRAFTQPVLAHAQWISIFERFSRCV